ncbi:Metacaspase-9 [Ancistrocladus abbreviatus]
MASVKKRMAVLVGCNYFNTQYELHGCINDVCAMQKLLTSRFGFVSNHVQVLTDEPNSAVTPTGANIKAALNRMIDQAEAGDVLFFHYSGHGTRIPLKNHLGQDEAIVPVDFNLITA